MTSLGAAAGGGVISFDVDFSSTDDFTDHFVALETNFTDIWVANGKLNFNRNGPDSAWSAFTPNLYAYRTSPTEAPLRLVEGSASMQTYLRYWDWRRGMQQGLGFFLYDPDKASGQLGAWDNPYVQSLYVKHGKWAEDGIAERWELTVSGGDVGAQTYGWTTTCIMGDQWVNHTLAWAPDGSGGYDITWTSTGKTTYSMTDHTSMDLSGAVLGVTINFREFMDASTMGEAFMDTMHYEVQPIPEPAALSLLAAAGLSLIRRRTC